MTGKIRVAILYGGRSAEHDVSRLSAANVLKAIDRTRYEVVPIAISREGRWLLQSSSEAGGDGAGAPVSEDGVEVALLPGGKGRLIPASHEGIRADLTPVDVVFPVLHGPFGEDGSVQGYAEVADVAYVGCGILASAAAMDKDVAKRLMREAGLAVARSVTVHRGDVGSFQKIAGALGLPFFAKPARQGSSFGVSKVNDGDGFEAAVETAFRYDGKVLIEEFIEGREIECSVLQRAGGSLTVSLPGEIIPAGKHGFYTYEAKYLDADGAVVKVPADVPAAIADRARDMAGQAFKALGCEAMARVDFFLRADGSLLVNEVNTLPGFTDISMYAKALAAIGIGYAEVIDALIEHALARHGVR
ncbi:D-alanine--D-alanine ligase [bacterium M00.F.Ca.ET.141.01.1.1]|uniref:D-alanine--D-alanine ligase family protein n=1 Tax=unclassified Mesorhizobium TaxID=325217 RepID=UPI000FD79E27|nr:MULTISPECIES: D-alanine--D-alanine ligase family protein [unclassified Mesorhizobium]TGR47116.1 D-alanine--D-alanine ligase [bacterium M00.F.Ca.ET.199.01.1.1]TGU36569.1 D-alanine--D-alanine ligase [bacterium M00.F.Ca.ET.156.01.1.1]TGV51587.1 D-alanine--D-alanine ligase [bacterium M00.F.Ca.ET.141.01.1.1]TGV87758.1 D-alanine--D-alanine ligase [Mesorhizobium sp. M00.F.Ca.ET.149.01.1.1]TGR28832.1 D-alanine--D-alanine ligase [Mesorhizobium sp. M8A.F.Ca.ET.202.01.1.1]